MTPSTVALIPQVGGQWEGREEAPSLHPQILFFCSRNESYKFKKWLLAAKLGWLKQIKAQGQFEPPLS